jgi:hypothetical protein
MRRHSIIVPAAPSLRPMVGAGAVTVTATPAVVTFARGLPLVHHFGIIEASDRAAMVRAKNLVLPSPSTMVH